MRFRKKPGPVIEAVRWTGDNEEEVTAFTDGTAFTDFSDGGLNLRTAEGVMRILTNNWIIKDAQGELFSVDPDRFSATYDKVEEE